MDTQPTNVLVIDDEPAIGKLVCQTLADKFSVSAVTSGEEGLSHFRDKPSHVVIVDVNLENSDGRELIQRFREDPANDPIILCMSADASEETVLSCFDSGADDFVAKPFSIAVLEQKIEALIRYQSLYSNMRAKTEELSHLVDVTMSQASSYGSLLTAVKKLNQCHEESQIADVVFNYLSSQGLNSAIYFTSPHQTTCFDSHSRICSPMLREVFELTHNTERLLRLRQRLIVTDQHVSFLVKNPPSEQSEEYGIFIDIVAVLIEALESRFMSLLRERELNQLQKELSTVIVELNTSIEDVRQKKQKLIDDIVLRIGLSFHELELTEEQEIFFNKLLEDVVMGHDDTNVVVSNLQSKLGELVNEIKQLVDDNSQTVQSIEDVELF